MKRLLYGVGLVVGVATTFGCAEQGSSDQVAQTDQALTGPPDVVLAWNATAAQMIVGPGGASKPPPLGLIDLAIVHTSIYDAINAVDGFPYDEYAIRATVTYPASAYAAGAQAAHDALLALYPANQAALDSALATSLSNVPDGDAKTNGIAVGAEVAAGILALRANDGRNAGGTYSTPGGAGDWVPTPPGFLPAQAPWVANVMPWTMHTPSQFRTEPPPTLDSDTWIADYNETKAYGQAGGTVATPAQQDIGKFWGDQPMLQWNRGWRNLSVARALTQSQNARFFAELAVTGSDALIACWDSKYTYGFWRPVTAIRAGGGNPALTADPTWLSLVVTPNHPEYPAAHGCFTGAIVYTLEAFFNTDDITFTLDSNFAGVTQTVRTYYHFSEALDEVKLARIYGGMHYRNSTEQGGNVGKQVSHFVTHHYFRQAH
jgi:hypothetical protein